MDIVGVLKEDNTCMNDYVFTTLFTMYNNTEAVDGITVTVKNSNGEYVSNANFLVQQVSGGEDVGINVSIGQDQATSKPKATIRV
jgi:hypothetical protein